MALTTRKRRRRAAPRRAVRRVRRRVSSVARRGRSKKKKIPLIALGGLVFGTEPIWGQILRGDVGAASRNAANYFGAAGIGNALRLWSPVIFGIILSMVFSKLGANKRLNLPFFTL